MRGRYSEVKRLKMNSPIGQNMFAFCHSMFRPLMLVGLVFFCLVSLVAAQDEKTSASDDLEAAFDRKIQAKTIKDFEEVVKLCKSALDKGLEDEDQQEAKLLASNALFEHAQQLTARLNRGSGSSFIRKKALSRLRESTKYNPEQTDAWMMIAQLNMLPGGDQDEALAAVDRTIGIADGESKKQSQAHYFRWLLQTLAKEEPSLDDLDKAIDLDGGNIPALVRRSVIRISDGDIEGGIEDSDKIVKSKEGDDVVLMAQAMGLRDLAVVKLVEIEQKKAAKSDEDGDDDDDEGSSVEELTADTEVLSDKIIEYIDAAIEIEEKDAYLRAQAEILALFKKEEKALAAVDRLLKKDESSIPAWLLKARILATVEADEEDQLECLDKAKELDPFRIETLELRRAFFASKGDYESALKEAKKIHKERATLGAKQDLAILYSVNEQPRKALKLYNEILEQIPSANRIQSEANPRTAMAQAGFRIGLLRSRADASLATGDHGDAVEDYEEALEMASLLEEIQNSISSDTELSTDEVEGIWNNLSWVLSTSNKDEVRDGDRALELAIKACESSDYKKPHILSTLAAAHAEKGDFKKAIEWIEKGIEANDKAGEKEGADPEGIKSQRESLEKELKMYQEDKPFRENEGEKAEDEDDKDEDEEEDDDSDKDEEDDEDKDV